MEELTAQLEGERAKAGECVSVCPCRYTLIHHSVALPIYLSSYLLLQIFAFTHQSLRFQHIFNFIFFVSFLHFHLFFINLFIYLFYLFLFSASSGDSSLEVQDLKSQLEECESRLEKGAEYVDYLQAQMEEMNVEIENLKQAEEVKKMKNQTCD